MPREANPTASPPTPAAHIPRFVLVRNKKKTMENSGVKFPSLIHTETFFAAV